MGIRLKKKENDFKTVDEGVYFAKCKSVGETLVSDEYEYLEFHFVLLDESGEETNIKVKGRCPQNFSPKSKLDAWLGAFGIPTIAVGEEFDTDMVLNRYVNVQTGNTQGKKKIEGTDKYPTFSNVIGLFPLMEPQKKLIATKAAPKGAPKPVTVVPASAPAAVASAPATMAQPPAAVVPVSSTPSSVPKVETPASTQKNLDNVPF